MTTEITTPVVRANMLEVGKNYLVHVHGEQPRVLKLTHKPEAPIARMAETDAFVFTGRNGRELEFKAHTNKGPKFLVTQVLGLRGRLIPVRVTFHEAPKAAPKAKKANPAPASTKPRKAKKAA